MGTHTHDLVKIERRKASKMASRLAEKTVEAKSVEQSSGEGAGRS
ncbi:MAG: hypothetical protein P8X46_05735 [Nitrospirales bacterium]